MRGAGSVTFLVQFSIFNQVLISTQDNVIAIKFEFSVFNILKEEAF